MLVVEVVVCSAAVAVADPVCESPFVVVTTEGRVDSGPSMIVALKESSEVEISKPPLRILAMVKILPLSPSISNDRSSISQHVVL